MFLENYAPERVVGVSVPSLLPNTPAHLAGSASTFGFFDLQHYSIEMANVFVSHRRTDAKEAKELATEIRARGHQVWLDDWEIGIGDSIVERIQDGLEGAHFSCPLLFPRRRIGLKTVVGFGNQRCHKFRERQMPSRHTPRWFRFVSRCILFLLPLLLFK